MHVATIVALNDELQKISADLTEAGRDKIKTKNFAEPGKRKYPIEDPAHARNALARVSQFGSSSEKAQVRAKVHAKYPGIGDDKEKKSMVGVGRLGMGAAVAGQAAREAAPAAKKLYQSHPGIAGAAIGAGAFGLGRASKKGKKS